MAGIPDATPQQLEAAMTLFDQQHRGHGEWAHWEENKAHKYAIRHDGKLYPVKMIISLATKLDRTEFYGGVSERSANAYVAERGFSPEPLRRRPPDWVRDELILALELYLRNRQSVPGDESEQVRALSAYLNEIAPLLHGPVLKGHRNPAGVAMKLGNYRRLDPMFPGSKGLPHGNQLEQVVWNEFGADPDKCRRAAEDIRSAFKELAEHQQWAAPSPDEDDIEAEEGRAVTRVHVGRERDRGLVRKKKDAVRKATGRLACEACEFEFVATYGERGRDFIECHHTKPIHKMKSGEKTKLSDLIVLCANCHRMIHKKKPWLTIDELRTALSR